MTSKRTLILLRGLPSSGKTTVSKFFNPYAHYEADQYFYDEDGKYNFDYTKLNEAHQQCLEKTEFSMKKLFEFGENSFPTADIVVSNTFTTEKEMQPYFDLAEKYNFDIFSLIVEKRHDSTNDHNVPEKTVTKMENRFQIKLK